MRDMLVVVWDTTSWAPRIRLRSQPPNEAGEGVRAQNSAHVHNPVIRVTGEMTTLRESSPGYRYLHVPERN